MLSFRNKPGRPDPHALLIMADNMRAFADAREAELRELGPLTREWHEWIERQRSGADESERDARALIGASS